jgi:hypothetical protein
LNGVQEVVGSNPAGPTNLLFANSRELKHLPLICGGFCLRGWPKSKYDKFYQL